MTCRQAQAELSLYLYGELTYSVEEALETHLAGCALCQQALIREKSWHATVRSSEAGPSLELLSRCRNDLRQTVATLTPARALPYASPWSHVRGWFDAPLLQWTSRAALAAFLVLLGFGLGRSVQAHNPDGFTFGFNATPTSSVRVRDVRLSDPGHVRLTVEHVHEARLSGSLADTGIRQIVLAAVQHSLDPAVRMDSVQALSGQDGLDVRDALISTVHRDPNAAVRLKALEALRPFVAEPETRSAIRDVLEADVDPAVRYEAISVLAPPRRAVEISPELINTMRAVARSGGSDDYVRLRAVEILQRAGAVSDSY